MAATLSAAVLSSKGRLIVTLAMAALCYLGSYSLALGQPGPKPDELARKQTCHYKFQYKVTTPPVLPSNDKVLCEALPGSDLDPDKAIWIWKVQPVQCSCEGIYQDSSPDGCQQSCPQVIERTYNIAKGLKLPPIASVPKKKLECESSAKAFLKRYKCEAETLVLVPAFTGFKREKMSEKCADIEQSCEVQAEVVCVPDPNKPGMQLCCPENVGEDPGAAWLCEERIG